MWHLVIPSVCHILSHILPYIKSLYFFDIFAGNKFVQTHFFVQCKLHVFIYCPLYFTGALHGTVHNGSHLFVSVRFDFKFDQTASLDGHVKSVCKSALFHLRNIAKIREYLNVESTKSLVHAFVTCRLDNCNSLLIGSPSFLIQKLQRIQNCAARLVTGQPKFAHVTPILKELHWLSIEQRVAFKVLLLAYKGLNGLAPKYISDMLVRYTPCRVLRSSERHLLNVPKTNKKTPHGDRAFSAAAPRLWNSLPLDLKISPSVSIFKSRLKTHLFKLAFN